MKKYFFLTFEVLLSLFLFVGLSGTLVGQNIKAVGTPVDFPEGNEYDPSLSVDGNTLAFVSDKSGQFKIYICQKDGDSWTTPEEIAPINNFNNGSGNIRFPSFNYDGSILYFSADYFKDSTDVDIFYSKKSTDGWSEPISIGAPINTKSYDGQPSISADNKTLYFSRNSNTEAYDDFDCKKIFVAIRNNEGNWNKPEALPIPINIDCEQCPKIGVDNKTLYFSSVREGGKGGFDIYKTKLIAKNVWVPAESIDTLNSVSNDYTPALGFNSELALFPIEQIDKKNKFSKLYQATIPPQFLVDKNVQLKGKILDLTSQLPIEATISVYDPVTSRLISSYSNDPNTGKYEIFLTKGNNYQIDFYKENHSHYFKYIEAEKLRKNEVITEDINLYKDIILILNAFDNELFRPVDATIEIRNSSNEIVQTSVNKEKDGRYRIKMPLGDVYKFLLKAEFYEDLAFEFDLTGIVQFDEFEKDAELKAKKVDFQIAIADEETQAGLPVEVIITNLDNNEVIRTTATAGSDGKYTIKLREGDRYSVSVSPKGYSFYNTTVDLKKKKAPKKLDVKLKQLKEDTKLTLNNITFEVNSADLNESSYSELDRVVKLMNDNPDINIEISAHTDNVGSDSYNLRLSDRRAASVETYLLEQAVNEERLVAKGYGESKPAYPNDTDEHKALNRRVELKIIKIQ